MFVSLIALITAAAESLYMMHSFIFQFNIWFLDFSETSFDVATTYTINVGTFRDGEYVKDFPLKSKNIFL